MDENKLTENREHNTESGAKKAKEVAVKSLAIIGLVVLLAFGTWGTVQIIRTAPGLLSELRASVSSLSSRFFPSGTSSLTLTPQSYTVKSDEAFTLTWNEIEAPAEHRYAFVFECANELSFTTPSPTGQKTIIACGELYTFESATRSIELTPLSHTNRFLDAAVKISMITGNQIVAEDEVLFTIVNERLTEITTTPTEKPTAGAGAGTTHNSGTSYYPVYTTVTAPRVSDPNGYVDLSIEILATGTLESRGDRFMSTGNTLDGDERGGVRFVIRNLGTKTAEDWTFEAKLPTRPSYTYKPKTQPDLGPGDRIEYTLGFDRLTRSDKGEIIIEVDPKKVLKEINRSNNKTSVTVNISD